MEASLGGGQGSELVKETSRAQKKLNPSVDDLSGSFRMVAGFPHEEGHPCVPRYILILPLCCIS